MGQVMQRVHFQRAGRNRLACRLGAKIREIPRLAHNPVAQNKAIAEVGEWIVTESRAGYNVCDLPPCSRVTPWLDTIDKLCEEFPEMNISPKAFLDAVNMYFEARNQTVQAAQTGA